MASNRRSHLPGRRVGLDMKVIHNDHAVLPLPSMQTGQVPPVQMSNVIIYTILGIQFMSNHKRNFAFLNYCGKQPVFLATNI